MNTFPSLIKENQYLSADKLNTEQKKKMPTSKSEALLTSQSADLAINGESKLSASDDLKTEWFKLNLLQKSLQIMSATYLRTLNHITRAF